MKEVKCFLINSTYITPDSREVNPVFELSEEGRTYSKRKQELWLDDKSNKSIMNYHFTDENELTVEEGQLIFKIVESFIAHVSSRISEDKPDIVKTFMQDYNAANVVKLSSVDYNLLISDRELKHPDYLTFTAGELVCSAWLGDASFRTFYPLYDIDITTPFNRFDNVVKVPKEMVYELSNWNLSEFIDRTNETNAGYPPTLTRTLNVPYHPGNGSAPMPCWFGFNIYGINGNYDHLLREELHDYLKDLGLSDEFIESHFPDIFKVNEFFISTEWDNYAIPFRTGQGSINSQVLPTYIDPKYLQHIVKTYEEDLPGLRKNTYDVPFTYNNIITRTVNGRHSKEDVKDFREYYKDLITVSSTGQQDFGRMSERTQRFVSMMEAVLPIADSVSQTEVFSKIMKSDGTHRFSLSKRSGVEFLSVAYADHRYYIATRYEFLRIKGEVDGK